jgi:hypothetical protein
MAITWNSGLPVIPVFAGVLSFNTRTGAVTLISADVLFALGYMPENAANKATTFGTLNNTLYPSTQAVADYVASIITGAVTSFNTRTGAITLLNADVLAALGTASTIQLAKLGIGVAATRFLDVLGTTEQMRLSYDASNFASFTVSAAGVLAISTSSNIANLAVNKLGISVNPASRLHVGGNYLQAAWGLVAPMVFVGGGTVSDNSTAAGATVGGMTVVSTSIGASLLTATNATPGSPVTYSNAATLYLFDAPGAGTNTVITNKYVIYTASGLVNHVNLAAQLQLSWDSIRFATFLADSLGNLTITPSGGVFIVGGNLRATLPTYSSGTKIYVVYNGTNNRFEAQASLSTDFVDTTTNQSGILGNKTFSNKLGVGGATPIGSQDLAVNNGIAAGGNIVAASTSIGKNAYTTSLAPSVTAGPGVGTGGTIAIVGNNQDHYVTLNVGTGSIAGVLFSVVMSGSFAYPNSCNPVISIDTFSPLGSSFLSTSPTATGYDVYLNNTGLIVGTVYGFRIHNGGY